MKKTLCVFIFIFLTALFAGLFFSTELSYENNDYLSALMMSGFSDDSAGSARTFFAALTSNLILVAFMLPSVVTRVLCPLPPLVLGFKSFAIGFCSGLLYLNDSEDAFILSALKIFPQSIFIIPAFILLSAALFRCSASGIIKQNRASSEKKALLLVSVLSAALLMVGCIIQTVFHSAAL